MTARIEKVRKALAETRGDKRFCPWCGTSDWPSNCPTACPRHRALAEVEEWEGWYESATDHMEALVAEADKLAKQLSRAHEDTAIERERADTAERHLSLADSDRERLSAMYGDAKRAYEAAEARADSLQKQVSELVRTARSEQVRANAAEARADEAKEIAKNLVRRNGEANARADTLEAALQDADYYLADNDGTPIDCINLARGVIRAALAASGGAADSKPWGPDHPSYDEMGQ